MSTELGVSDPEGFLCRISPVFRLRFLLREVGIAASLPACLPVGKEAGVNVICVVLSSAAGDVKLKERLDVH